MSLFKILLFFFLLNTFILNIIFVKLHRNIQNIDTKCLIIEKLLNSYDSILENDTFLAMDWKDASKASYLCLKDFESSNTNSTQNDSQLNRIVSTESIENKINFQNQDEIIDLNNNSDILSKKVCSSSFNSIARLNQYIGYWRFRNHFLKVSNELNCNGMNESIPYDIKHQFIEESSSLEVYPFIVNLNLYIPEEALPKATSKIEIYLKEIVYRIIKRVLQLCMIKFELRNNYSYYYSLEEGFLGIRRRYGIPTIQANISITEPFLSNLYDRSYIPQSLQQLVFRINPYLLGHESIINQFFLQQTRMRNTTDYGFLINDHNSLFLKFRRYKLRYGTSFLDSLRNYNLREFYDDNISPFAFYIFLHVANLFILRSCLSFLLYALRIIEHFNNINSFSGQVFGLLRALGELEIRFFAVYYLMVFGLYHIVNRFIGNTLLSVLLIAFIWLIQCIAISRVNRIFSSLYMEIFNVIIVAFLCYVRMYPITGIPCVAFTLAISYMLCVSGLLYLNVEDFFSTPFEESILESWLNSESQHLFLNIHVRLEGPIEIINTNGRNTHIRRDTLAQDSQRNDQSSIELVNPILREDLELDLEPGRF